MLKIRSAVLCLFSALLAPSGAMAHDGEVTPFPKSIQRGETVRNLSLGSNEFVVWRVDLPVGATNLVIKTWGGTGDCDIVHRAGAHPTDDLFDHESAGGDNNERVAVAMPTVGANYIGLRTYEPVSGMAMTVTYNVVRRVDHLPRFSPSSAVFAGVGKVAVYKPVQVTGVLRYTTDGSDPIATSPRVERAIEITSATDLRARFFPKKGAPGPVARAFYDAKAEGTTATLASGIPARHLAGRTGTMAIFKFTTSGDRDLVFQTADGTGDSRILVKHGTPPTTRSFDYAANAHGNNATLRVKHAAAGDWFVGVRGVSDYRHCTLSVSQRSEGADLIVWPDALQPEISLETFNETDCEVQEGMITAGTHRLLRFSTETRNIGLSNIVLPAPEGNPAFEYADCHGHYHFKGFARYRLLNGAGDVVATGRKVSFCLLDGYQWDPGAADGQFSCDMQGITAGWSDVYDAGLPGQWVEIDGVPAGDYFLEVTMNPDLVILESDVTNNTSTVPVTIPAP